MYIYDFACVRKSSEWSQWAWGSNGFRLGSRVGDKWTRASHVLFLSRHSNGKPKHHLNQESHLRIDPPRKTLHMHEVTKVSPSLSFRHTLYAYFTIVLESREMGGVTEPPFQLQLADHFALYSCGSASYKPLHLDKDSYRVLGHIKRRKIGTPQFIAATERERESGSPAIIPWKCENEWNISCPMLKKKLFEGFEKGHGLRQCKSHPRPNQPLTPIHKCSSNSIPPSLAFPLTNSVFAFPPNFHSTQLSRLAF